MWYIKYANWFSTSQKRVHASAGRQGIASQVSPCALSGIGGFERRYMVGMPIIIRKNRFARDPRGNQVKIEDQYLKLVLCREEDSLYVGYCPDFFPWGGVCHGNTEEEAYHQLCDLVREEVNELRKAGKELPPPGARPMREAVLA
ncbi:MAG: hypothetical protein ABSH21_05735 [Verrucomicrobiia bacterium]